MFTIVLLEDEQVHEKELLSYLNRFSTEHPDFCYNVTSYHNSLDLLSNYHCSTDLLFLDIQVPDMKGIDVAKRIREIDQQTTIVFITNLMQYAIEGYAVRAFDYILKPLSYPVFCQKFSRIIQSIQCNRSEVFVDVHTKTESMRISSNCILYIEVFNHDITIHTDHGTLTHWGSLSKYENLLQNAHFARCSSCYLVNLKFVTKLEGDYVFVNQRPLSMSKSKRKHFLSALAQYKGGSN